MKKIADWKGFYICVGMMLGLILVCGVVIGDNYARKGPETAYDEEVDAEEEDVYSIWDGADEYGAPDDEITGTKVPFGDGCFYLVGNGSYVENGVLDFRQMADDNDHPDDWSDPEERVYELSASHTPDWGSYVTIHGATSEKDHAYVSAYVAIPHCSVRIEFNDSAEERALSLENGGKVSQLAVDLLQYVFETCNNHPSELKSRFLLLERWAKSAGAEVRVRYDADARYITWEDVEHTGIMLRGELFPLRQMAEEKSFLAETPIKGSGVSYHHYKTYADNSRPEAEIRVYGSWRGEDPYFEAVLNDHTTVRVMFGLEAGDELVELENGSKIPVLMARTIELALQSLAYYPGYFEERFDALDKSGRPGVEIDIALRDKTSEVKLADDNGAPVATEEQYGDGWITTRKRAAAWIKDGQLDLNGLALDCKWRVDPAVAGEMTLFPQKTMPGNYMILSSYNIKVYGGGADAEYAYVLLSGPWFRIKIEFFDFAGEETVQLENGRIIPQRAVWVVEKAIETLNEDVNIYDVFEGLKESCPKGAKINAAHFS